MNDAATEFLSKAVAKAKADKQFDLLEILFGLQRTLTEDGVTNAVNHATYEMREYYDRNREWDTINVRTDKFRNWVQTFERDLPLGDPK